MTFIHSRLRILRRHLAPADEELTEQERTIADRMIKEAEALKREGGTQNFRHGGQFVKLEHDLLYDMLWWFGCQHRLQEKPALLVAARILQQHATWFVRNPALYRVECAEARQAWEKYLCGAENRKHQPRENKRGCDKGHSSSSGNEDEDSTEADSPEEVVSKSWDLNIRLD